MRDFRERLEYALFQGSRTLPPPWGQVVRLLRYPAAIARDWLSGEISVRAMSLAYTTLLSIVPLLVFVFSVLKAIGARGDLRYILKEFFRPMGGAAAQLTDSVLQFVDNMRGDVLGAIGLASLLYTVVSTIHKVEAGFNFVWRVQRPRSLGRRLVEYLSVMILGPLLLAVAVQLLGSAERSPFAHWLTAVPLLASLSVVLGASMPYLLVTAAFTLMYALLPNTRVQLRPALVGGVTGGILWALTGKVFTAFILYSSQLLAVYTGFAVVLTTLIWVYLSWLILLIGAQLAFYVQFPECLRQGHAPTALAECAHEHAGLAIMLLIGRGAAPGKDPWTPTALAAELDVPDTALVAVLARLERAGLLVTDDEGRLQPARGCAEIRLVDIVAAVRGGSAAVAGESPAVPAAAAVVRELDAAIRERLAGRTLEDLLGR